MNKPIDVRAWRRSDGITSASSHPELVEGDLAIPRRRFASPMALYHRRRALGGTLAVAAIAVLLTTIAFRSSATLADGDAGKQELARTCLQWHQAASAVVSRQVQSTRDADLVQVNDSVFRMRRARRNCEAGWVTLACQDYHAVAISVPAYAVSNDLFPCARVAMSFHQ